MINLSNVDNFVNVVSDYISNLNKEGLGYDDWYCYSSTCDLNKQDFKEFYFRFDYTDADDKLIDDLEKLVVNEIYENRSFLTVVIQESLERLS